MAGWNLPPGCNVSDLPGNTPEDEAWEAMNDELVALGMYPKEILQRVKDYQQAEIFLEKMRYLIRAYGLPEIGAEEWHKLEVKVGKFINKAKAARKVI